MSLADAAVWAETALLARRLSRRPAAGPDPGPRYLVLAPTSRPGSGGDEVTVAACVTALRERGLPVHLVVPDDSVRWPEPTDLQYVVAPGLFRRSAVLRRAPLGVAVGPRDTAVLLATDVLDGTYSPARVLRQLALLHAVKRAGGRAAVVSFTFRDRVDSLVERRLRVIAPVVSPRDEDSAANIRRSLPTAAAAGLRPAPDIAFLLPGPQAPAPGVRRTVVNIHPSLCPTEAALDRLVGAVADGVAGCADLLLLGHDSRSRIADELALRRLRAELEGRGTPAPVVPALPPSEVRELLRRTSCVVTGRMHLAVAALATGVPTVCIAYGGRKFEGLRAQAGIDVPLLDPATLTGTALRAAVEAACRVPRLQRGEAATQLRARAGRHIEAIVGLP